MRLLYEKTKAGSGPWGFCLGCRSLVRMGPPEVPVRDYDADYMGPAEDPKAQEWAEQQFYESPLASLAPSTYTEVAPGACHLLARAKAAGWDVLGVDVNPASMERGTALGCPVEYADFREWETSRRAEVVGAVHFLEHFADPVPILRALLQKVAPGGYLFLHMPNAEKCLNDAWWHFWPEHELLLTMAGLAFALKQAGGSLVNCGRVCDDLWGWAQCS